MKKFQDFKQDLLKDKRVTAEYEKLEPQFQVVSQLIEGRLKKGVTQKELAEKIGSKQSAIARLESGMTNPTIGMLEKISKALGTKFVINIG